LKSEATAQAVAGMSVLVLALYTGYAIPQPSMIGALRWITYINVRLANHIAVSVYVVKLTNSCL
jgi:ABC-type multidrug transport system permease subunit